MVWCSHPGAMLAVLMRRATTCGHKSLKVWLNFDRLIRSITSQVSEDLELLYVVILVGILEDR